MNSDNVIELAGRRKPTKPKKKFNLDGLMDNAKYNIIDSCYITPGGDQEGIIIVLVEDPGTMMKTAYAGTGKDEQSVATWGSKLTQQQAESFFGPKIHKYRK